MRLEDPVGGRRRLSSIVAERLTQLVIDGSLQAGDALPSESEIARQFNVSKPTVREAIDQLSVLGVIRVQQGKQSIVTPLNSSALEGFFRYAVHTYREGLTDTMEMRRGIEMEAAALAAERIDAEGVRILNDIVKRMEEGLYSPAAWLAADFEFHAALARLSGNKMILQVFNGISEAIRYMQKAVHMQRDMRIPNVTLQSHKDIAQAVIDKDPARARETMLIHCTGGIPIMAAIMADQSRRVDID